MQDNQFVSVGGLKLQHAIENWKLDIKDLIVLDVGSSTGGFVDCLLQNGAKKVFAVDTAYGQLDWKLRNDPRVIVMERTNILHLENLSDSLSLRGPISSDRGNLDKRSFSMSKQSFSMSKITTSPMAPRNDTILVDLVTIDAGWTKLELVLPVVKKFLKPNGQIIALLKPNYETSKENLIKGVVKPDKLEGVVQSVNNKIESLGFNIEDQIESPILGSHGKGNQEYLLLIKVD